MVDPGAEAVRNAGSRGLSLVICATLETAGFVEQSLPAIGLFDVLEHIRDDGAFLRQARALLADGGRLYVSVPAYRLLWSAVDAFGGHHRRYTAGRLKRLLAKTGYTVEFDTYFFALLPLPILLLRSVPYRLGLRRRQEALYDLEKQHAPPSGLCGALLASYLTREERILKRHRLAFGASHLAVARAS